MTVVQKQNYFDYNAIEDRETRAFLRKRAETGKALLKRTAEGVWQIGSLLAEVKGRISHGQYEHWVRTELGLSQDSAHNFLNVFLRFQNPNFSDFDVAPSVLYLLAKPSVDDETREVAVALMGSGDLRTTSDARVLIQAAKPPQNPKNSDFEGLSGEIVEPETDDMLPLVEWPQQEPTTPAPSATRPAKPVPQNPKNSDFEAAPVPEPEPESEPDPEAEDPYTGEPKSETKPVSDLTLQEKEKAAQVVYDTLINKPKDEDLSDDDWLATVPVFRVLKDKPHKAIFLKRDLLGYRKLADAKRTFDHHARRAFDVKALDNTPMGKLILLVTGFPEPRDWQICAPCRGNGCTRCNHAGYDTSGAGISALRVESGEVTL